MRSYDFLGCCRTNMQLHYLTYGDSSLPVQVSCMWSMQTNACILMVSVISHSGVSTLVLSSAFFCICVQRFASNLHVDTYIYHGRLFWTWIRKQRAYFLFCCASIWYCLQWSFRTEQILISDNLYVFKLGWSWSQTFKMLALLLKKMPLQQYHSYNVAEKTNLRVS